MMKALADRYGAFIRQPDVAWLLGVALVSRMPIGMVGYSMLMFLRQGLGDFALAGSAVGANFIAMAAAAPVQGRLIDRLGPKPVLYVTGIVQPLALGGILYSVSHGLPFVVIALCAALAGAFASPITTITRTIWRHRFEREEDRRTAFALDAVTIEINFTLGPALMAAMLAAFGARAAFTLAIATVVLAISLYLLSGALRHVQRVVGVERHLLGPLTQPRLWIVFAATFGLTACFGLLEVGYPAFGTALEWAPLGGILLAVNSLGSAAGGMFYGGTTFRASVERQFATAMALMAVPLALHATFLQPVAFGVVAFFAGALIAPSITAQSVLVSRMAPAKYATEAFTWSSTFIVSGIGCGIALGGALVEHSGLRTAFATGAIIMVAMALLAYVALPTPATAPAAD